MSEDRAVLVFSTQHGDVWEPRCPRCTWRGRHKGKVLPLKTREEAEHITDLHAVLCRGKR